MKKNSVLIRGIYILFIIQMFSTGFIYSQHCKEKADIDIGLGLEQSISSSGHGLITGLNVSMKLNKNEIDVGVLLQTKQQKFSGLQMKYKYFVVNNDDIGFYLHTNVMYQNNISLTQNMNEAFHRYDVNECLNYELYNTLESYMGFGLQFPVYKKLIFEGGIGLGAYFSEVIGEDNRCNDNLVRDDNSFSAMFSLGFKYNFRIDNKRISWN